MNYSLVELKHLAYFRLFAHTKRDIVVAGCTSGGTSFSTKGDALSLGEKSVPSTHKKIPPFVQPPQKTRLAWVRTDDLWV